MQNTKISVVSHLRMLLLIFDRRDPLVLASKSFFDCFTEPDQGSFHILLDHLSFILASHLTFNFNQLDSELNNGDELSI